jgi:predicted lipoprotein
MKKSALTLVSSALFLTACGGGGSSSGGSSSADACSALNSDSFNCTTMLAELDQVQYQAAEQFSTQLANLQQQTNAYCAAIGSEQQAATRTAAQQSWQQAMLSWQKLEVMQFGPVKEYRNAIYSWPLSVNKTCNMDGVIASGNFDSTTPQQRGLPAVEYVLFADAPLPSCSDAPEAAADAAKRCAFAQAAIESMRTNVANMSFDLGSYEPAATPGGQASAQELFEALFYVYNQTKGEKLQKTVLPENQNEVFEPEKLEIAFADINAEVIAANLEAAQALMTAGNGNNGGFASYLVAAGQADLANNMLSSLQTAIDGAKGLNASVRDIVTTAATDNSDNDVDVCINADATSSGSDVAELCALDSKIKVFTDDLKGQMALNLGLTVPGDAESDGD